MSGFEHPGQDNDTSMVKHTQEELLIGDAKITLVCSTYANRHFILISQIDKIGTFVTGKAIVGIDSSVHYEVNILFGKRDDQLLQVYCRQIIEKIYRNGSTKPVLLAISLLENGRSVECFQNVLDKLDDIATW